MSEIASLFIGQSRAYLRDEYLPKIEICLDQLTPEQLWWRPNANSNSIGNLLLHLAGNVRQWIVCGLGGALDDRKRQREFDERQELEAHELIGRLRSALQEVDGVLARIDPSTLLGSHVIQGTEVTTLAAIYHVVEHFAMHTGQIAYITKHLTGADLSFYDVKHGVATPTWKRNDL